MISESEEVLTEYLIIYRQIFEIFIVCPGSQVSKCADRWNSRHAPHFHYFKLLQNNQKQLRNCVAVNKLQLPKAKVNK